MRVGKQRCLQVTQSLWGGPPLGMEYNRTCSNISISCWVAVSSWTKGLCISAGFWSVPPLQATQPRLQSIYLARYKFIFQDPASVYWLYKYILQVSLSVPHNLRGKIRPACPSIRKSLPFSFSSASPCASEDVKEFWKNFASDWFLHQDMQCFFLIKLRILIQC